MTKRSLVWFKNNLRFHDNEPLTKAISEYEELVFFSAPILKKLQKSEKHTVSFIQKLLIYKETIPRSRYFFRQVPNY